MSKYKAIQGGIDERLGRQIWLYHTEGNVKTGKVAIKHGIFQGDSLSPLLLSSALIPLTTSKSLTLYLSHVTGKHEIMQQKTATMCTHTCIVTVMEMYYVEI
jgi:hypothetical protein